MVRLFWLLTGFTLSGISSLAQDSLVHKKDSLTQLNELVVHAYANDRPLSEIPAAVSSINSKHFERFNNTSFLPAVNTIPGVRMEERSPGSYRFAIRGSSLRSPFGVRNVKIYWNGLPLTDGGGNTYLNLIDFNAVGKAEIIKGPGASLYGAGTGGVVLLSSPASSQNFVQLSAIGGGYGLQRYQFSHQVGSQKINALINYAHQQSDGYRTQTNMRRDAVNTQLRFRLGSHGTLSASLFYTDLYYQTPGGLTQAQYSANPRQARPATTKFPGAVQQQAAVNNRTGYGAAYYEYQWNDRWYTKVGLYGSLTSFINPTINNYEKRKEDNWGGRTETQHEFGKGSLRGKLTLGGEYQSFYSTLADYGNRKGVQDTLQTDDRLSSKFFMFFGQVELDLPGNLFVTVGGSENFLNYKLNRISVTPNIAQTRSFNPVLSPRIAVLKKMGENFSLFANVSKGFSPPTLAEVRPSTSTFNNGLGAEQGISYELGIRGNLWRRISFDVAAYDFELNKTIVVQQQVNGQDFFINAGNTKQKGIESMLSWSPNLRAGNWVSSLRLWGSYTLNRYRFDHYVKSSQDYSGHMLTGVSPNILVTGTDISLAKHFYANVTLNYVDRIPVNDANSQFAPAYFLTGIRGGYRTGTKAQLELFAGVDNAANRLYSLGNDLNASGNRYYNAAPGRSFYFGLKLRTGLKGG